MKKDSKGRNLKANEDQLKNGRYRYRYTDQTGKRRALYSWKLMPMDKLPIGKNDDISLREKERALERDEEDNINTYMASSTVNTLIGMYLDLKTNLAPSTKENYNHLWNKNIKDSFIGQMKICDVKKSDIQRLYSYFYKDRKFTIATIQLYQNFLFPSFQMAVDDNIIRVNPCRNCMKDYTRGSMSSPKEALSRAEQDILLSFTRQSSVFSNIFPLIAFMLGTGCRISETLGMTWNNIDLENACVTVDHQIIYGKKNGSFVYYASLPKTKKIRVIPIQSELVSILKKYKSETFFVSHASPFEVDGYKDFVFTNSVGKLKTPNTVVRTFHSIQTSYNKREEALAEKEHRIPVFLPSFSPHVLRHTYCTRLAEEGIDVKVLQELMGHANISVTMQVYNHSSFERAQRAINQTPDVLTAIS